MINRPSPLVRQLADIILGLPFSADLIFVPRLFRGEPVMVQRDVLAGTHSGVVFPGHESAITLDPAVVPVYVVEKRGITRFGSADVIAPLSELAPAPQTPTAWTVRYVRYGDVAWFELSDGTRTARSAGAPALAPTKSAEAAIDFMLRSLNDPAATARIIAGLEATGRHGDWCWVPAKEGK